MKAVLIAVIVVFTGGIALAVAAILLASSQPLEAFPLVAILGFLAWTAADIAFTPLSDWQSAGRSKPAWFTGVVLGTVFGLVIVGLALGVYYAWMVRPYVKRGEHGPGNPPFPILGPIPPPDD